MNIGTFGVLLHFGKIADMHVETDTIICVSNDDVYQPKRADLEVNKLFFMLNSAEYNLSCS